MLLLLPLMLAGTACSGAASAQSDTASRRPEAANPCRPSELRALFRGFRPAGAAVAGAVVVANSGSEPCWLDGSPRSVSLIDDAGDAVMVKEHAVHLPTNGEAVKLTPGAPLPAFGAPPARGSAWFMLTWSNWCSDSVPIVKSLLIVLPAGGSITAPLDTGMPSLVVGPSAPQCPDSHSGSTLTFGRFQAPAE